ncbi:retinol dehydrogenase 12-like isoform X6 [Mercenaria mercenaria]|uniref:retinol dehydrogenase 12-like isoform X6 n=1 Tax=Mercenaria mercenaria TaxID=6596 RepID=UPI00234ED778|nr:retinol dehydrogenase 12-like isoform X6 [Mercenaria mercenaria]XP_053407648.1 retinol dehydrogenase 12-like isoform X6 [Mercenaria mercenaria]
MEMFWQIVVAVFIVLLSALAILKVYLDSIKGKCTSSTDLSGKVAIVTGANTGIGYFTALDFARRNARVILACRDLVKGQEAVEKIRGQTGNTDNVVIKLDLSLMKSVREFAEQINKQEARLDILVNNAGMAGLPLTKTDEGFEVMYATNHFGHFLLTNLLLGLLKKSQPSRIVNVSSMAHRWSKGIDFDNLKAEKSYSITDTYFSSKLANILFTRELARKLEGTGVQMTLCAVHPGLVQTQLLRHLPLHLKVLEVIITYFWKETFEQYSELFDRSDMLQCTSRDCKFRSVETSSLAP